MVRRVLAAVFIFLCEPGLAQEGARDIAGIAVVKDGDGILFGGLEVRLQGIAAPEYNSRKKELGGLESLNSLRALVEGRRVVCRLDGTKTRNRPVGICYLKGQDIGAHQVRNGSARDCPRFSRGRYAELEKRARAAGKNLSRTYPLPSYCTKN
jgi:micrococcal nuclease